MRYAHNPHLQRRNHRKGCCAPDNHADGRPGLGLRQQRIASMIAISSSRKPFSVPETDRSANLPPR